MAVAGIWLSAIALADIVAGLSGQVTDGSRRQTGLASAVLSSCILSVLCGLSTVALLLVTLWTAVSCAAWLWSRAEENWSPRRATAMLSAVIIGFSGTFLLGVRVTLSDNTQLDRLIEDLPYESLAVAELDEIVFVIGVLLFLQATANGLVRVVLALVGSAPKSQNELRGGRMIGPLERTLMFGILSTGSLVAAGLVVTAKGLVRFPELNQKGADDLEAATEYFLVGSLVSWLITLGAWMLVPR